MNKEDLISDIKEAFKEVSLEEGIGIVEADAIDDYADKRQQEKARSLDERNNWENIPDEVISKASFSLCYVDEKGMRFSLPAYMVFLLKNHEVSDSASIDAVIYALDRVSGPSDKGWDFLSKKQKEVVAKFLKFLVIGIKEGVVDDVVASRAYEKYWSKFDEQA